jgi:predicted nuclease of predicted toxin-antitoxin system
LKCLLLDQGLPRGAGRLLGALGWDVVHVGDIDMSCASDREILAFAERDGRVCVTLDADFHTLLALSGAAGPSTVRIRIEGLNAARLAELVVRVWLQIGHELEQGVAVTVDERKIRLRRLPLQKVF